MAAPQRQGMEFLFVHTLHDSEGQLADFRLQELDSLATLFGAPTPVIPTDSRVDSPFTFGQLPSVRHARRVCRRAVLLKSATSQPAPPLLHLAASRERLC